MAQFWRLRLNLIGVEKSAVDLAKNVVLLLAPDRNVVVLLCDGTHEEDHRVGRLVSIIP